MLLAENLQSVGDAAAHDAGVGDGFPALGERGDGRRFENQHQYAVEDGAGCELDQGQAHAVKIPDDVLDADNLDGEAERADQGIHVALVDAEILGDADEVHTDSGDYDACSLQDAYGAAQKDVPQQGDEDDVERGDEAALAYGRVHDAQLLHIAGDAEGYAADNAAFQQAVTVDGVITAPDAEGAAAQLVRDKAAAEQENRSQNGAGPVEGERFYILSADALRDERGTPDEGAYSKHKDAAKSIFTGSLVSHKSTLLNKTIR